MRLLASYFHNLCVRFVGEQDDDDSDTSTPYISI